METITVQNIISLIIVFISWIMIIFLFTSKSKNKLSNQLLLAFLLINAQDSSGILASLIYDDFPGLGMLINSTVFLKLPLLYLYILSLIYKDFRLSKTQILHITPFVADLLIFMPNYYMVDSAAKLEFLNSTNFLHSNEIVLSYNLIGAQVLFYIVLSYIKLIEFKSIIRNKYSDYDYKNYEWLFQLLLVFSIASVVALIKNVFLFADQNPTYTYLMHITNVLALVFVALIIMKALYNPNLFRQINTPVQKIEIVQNHRSFEKKKIETEVLNDMQLTEEIGKLKKYMANEQPYLNSELTLDQLSSQLNMQAKDLSYIINKQLGLHFFDFVNSYRIEKAMEMLSCSEKNLTVLEILYSVGFNSKSSFNTAFKKYTNLTPTEFKNQLEIAVA